MKQQGRRGQNVVGSDCVIQGLGGNGKELEFYTFILSKKILEWVQAENAQHDFVFKNISLAALQRVDQSDKKSRSRKTRQKFTDAVGVSDGGVLAWGREVERAEYVVKVESIGFASLN